MGSGWGGGSASPNTTFGWTNPRKVAASVKSHSEYFKVLRAARLTNRSSQRPRWSWRRQQRRGMEGEGVGRHERGQSSWQVRCVPRSSDVQVAPPVIRGIQQQSSDSRFTHWCWEVEEMIYHCLRSYLLEQISRNYIYQGGCEVAPYFPAKKPYYALLK